MPKAYENTKEKLHRTNAAIWFNKVRTSHHLTPNYIKITINSHNKQWYNIMKVDITYRINKKLKLLNKEKNKHLTNTSTTYIFSSLTNGPPLEKNISLKMATISGQSM